MSEERRIGIAGLGRMGRALAAELAAEGYSLVVYNRTPAVAAEVAGGIGADVARTPRELAELSSLVLVLVADGPALLDLIGGPDGLAAGSGAGTVVADMGTTGIEYTRRAREALDIVGASLVEAPVSGSVPTIQSRALLTMLGGDDDAVAVVAPVLDVVSKQVVHVGGPGCGAAMKLAVNAVLFGLNQAVAEALVLAERSGIDRTVAYDVFANSAVGAPVVGYRRGAFLEPGASEVTFSVDLAVKDLGLITDLADQVGASLPQSRLNREILAEASASRLGDADLADVAVYLRLDEGSGPL